mgnify:CR=1 FL=1
MNTIYIIIEENSYDGYDIVGDESYTTKEQADKVCEELNKKANTRRNYFAVWDLQQKDIQDAH